jgi:RNA polymerase sigma factor (sigma-70 family)
VSLDHAKNLFSGFPHPFRFVATLLCQQPFKEVPGMAADPLHMVVQHLRVLAAKELTDRQLVARFVTTKDEAAFEVLVRRHGRLVHSVCRRILGVGPDMEDAFQATFAVLARKAASIRKRMSLGSWLYGVAYRLAMQARSQRGRLRRRESTASDTLDLIAGEQTMYTDPAERASLREWGTILDEELQRLPAGCRDALVTCLMCGLSNVEAAKQLGWPLGTLKTRLQRGRDLLRERLERRGVALSAIALSLVLTEQARAVVPAALVRATVQGVTQNALSVTVAALASGTMRSLAAVNVKICIVAAVAAGLCGFGAAAVPFSGTTEATGKLPIPAKEQAKKPAPRKDVFGDLLPADAVARLGTLRWRHDDVAHFVAFLPDGKAVVSVAKDRFIRVWDYPSGKELRRFGPGPQPEPQWIAMPGGIGSGIGPLVVPPPLPSLLAVSNDGRLIATGFEPEMVDVWDISTGMKVSTIRTDKRYDIWALGFAPDGKHLAIASSAGAIRIWNIESAKVVSEFAKDNIVPGPVKANIGPVVYSPDGNTIVSLVQEKKPAFQRRLRFWSPHTGRELYSLDLSNVLDALSRVFSPDSQFFAYATRDSEIFILRTTTGEVLQKIKMLDEESWTLLAFAADSSRLYSKSSNMSGIVFQEWDLGTGKRLRRFDKSDRAAGGWVHFDMFEGCLALAPDGKTLATAAGNNVIHFFDLADGKDLTKPEAHAYSVSSLNYTSDGKSVVTCGTDGTMQLWDTSTGKALQRISQPNKAVKATTTDGHYIAGYDYKSLITLVDNTTSKEVAAISIGDQHGSVHFFFSPDGRIMLVHDSKATKAVLYDAATGKEQCRVAIPANGQKLAPYTATLFFSPDAKRLAVYSYTLPRSLTIHETQTGKALQHVLKHEQVGIVGGAFSPDRRTLALDYGDGLVHVIETASGKERQTYGTHDRSKPNPLPGTATGWVGSTLWSGEAGASTVAFSPDGRLLAHADPRKTVNVWDVTTGKSLAQFKGHTGKITGVAFAPDSSSVASASHDTTALLWDLRGLK